MLKKVTILFLLAISLIILNLSGMSGCGGSSTTPEATGGSGGGDSASGGSGGASGSGGSGGGDSASGGSGGASGSGGSGGSAGSNADLSALSLSKGSLNATFDANTTSYTASVNFLTQSVQLTPTLSDTSATMTVNGTSLASGATTSDITLTTGSNTLTIVVTGQDTTTTKTYTITLTRESISDFAQQAYVKASNTGEYDSFGYSVALYGDTLAVGASGEDSNATGINGDQSDDSASDSGAVYIFTRSGTTWTQQAYIKASHTGAGDGFGASVALSENTLAVAATGEDSNATGINGDQSDDSASGSGAVYVFMRSGTTWTQQAYIKASNTGAGDGFGASVALSENTLAVSASSEGSSSIGINSDQSDNSALESGAVYVFTRSGTTWTQQAYVKASNTGASDYFGYSISLYGDTLAVGSYYEESAATGINGDQSDNSASGSGAVYLFTRSGTTWTQQAYIKASNTGAGDGFGDFVALSENTLAVGANSEESAATGINGNQSDNSASGAGAVYIFTRSGTAWTQQAYIKASNVDAAATAIAHFGSSIALYGETLAVGGYGEGSAATGINGDQLDDSASGAGAVYVFTRSGTTWTQQAYIKASNTGADDYFSFSLALYEDTLVVGANQEDSGYTGVNAEQSSNSATDSGAIYIFQ